MLHASSETVINAGRTLITDSEDEYRRLDLRTYSAALLKRPPDCPQLRNTRAAVKYLPPHFKMKFNIVVAGNGDVVLQGQSLSLPTVFQNEFARIGALHARMTDAYGKLLVGQFQRLAEPLHVHEHFGVTVVTFCGTGTYVKNSDGETYAAEGDTTFVNAGVRHASTDFENALRKAMAVYVDPEPSGMKPW